GVPSVRRRCRVGSHPTFLDQSFRAPSALELLLFCLSKREVTKRKRHPAWRLPPIPERQVREPEPGFSAARPCTVEKASASCRCPLRGLIVSDSPPHRGPRRAGGPILARTRCVGCAAEERAPRPCGLFEECAQARAWMPEWRQCRSSCPMRARFSGSPVRR